MFTLNGISAPEPSLKSWVGFADVMHLRRSDDRSPKLGRQIRCKTFGPSSAASEVIV
jgi:hypothetical protein